MKIYLAAASYRQKEVRNNHRKLERRGFEVVSSWVFMRTLGAVEKFPREAKRDLSQIDECDYLILHTEDAKKKKYTTGGRFVEFGYAVAKGKKILIVGPRENVFCYMGWPQFDTFKEAMIYLQNAG